MSYPTFSFGCICGPKFQNLCLYVTGSLQIGTHLHIQLFSNRSARRFQTFHSKLSVVWAKRSLVANNIESKSYYSPLILHSVRVLQKYAFEYTKTKVSLRRFFCVPTKHCPYIKKYTLYTESMCHIFYSTYADAWMYQGSSCRGFTLLLQLLKSKNSVQTCFAINNTFASSANMSKLLLFTQMIFG